MDTSPAAVVRPEISLKARDDDGIIRDLGARNVVRIHPDQVYVRCCQKCKTALQGQHVPPHSLVRVDCGLRPSHLLPLTPVEQLIVAQYIAHRQVIILRPANFQSFRTTDTFGTALRGHVIASPSDNAQKLVRFLPMLPSAMPEHISVILISAAPSHDKVCQL